MITLRALLALALILTATTAATAQQERWTLYTTKNSGLPNDHIRDVAIDRDGVAWIATWGGGLARFDGTTWRVYNTTNSGLANDIIYDLEFDEDGKLWMAYSMEGIGWFDGERWWHMKTPGEGIVQCIQFDDDGLLWVGTYKEGLYTYDGDELKKLWGGSGALEDGVYDIEFDREGNAWIATRVGVLKYDGDSFTEYSEKNTPLKNGFAYDVAIGDPGHIWIAQYHPGKLGHFDGERWEGFEETTPELDFDYNGDTTYIIHTVSTFSNGDVLISTQFKGALAVYDGKTWKAILTPYSSDPASGISCVTLENDRRIWVGTWRFGLMLLELGPKEPEAQPQKPEREEKNEA